MSRSALSFWIAGGLVCAVLAYLLFENLERETVQERGNMSLEARRNRYLAAERFLAHMGRKIQWIKDTAVLDSLPEGGVLVLMGRRKEVMSKARAQEILDWVARGGYLILERDGAAEDDPLLLPFGVADDDDTVKRPDIMRRERDGLPAFFVEARLPGNDQRYRLAYNRYHVWEMKSGVPLPLWRVDGLYGSVMLHYAWERGNVTMMNRLEFLDNDELDDFDHAEFFWAVLRRYQPEGLIHFVARMQYPTLWQWLLTTAWRVLPSAAVLILLWLFWVVPRFGGVRAAPETGRRGLAEHLLAMGRCLWRENALASLLDTARREIAWRLAQRHPQILRLSVAEQNQALARQSGLAVTEIDAALHGAAPPSPETFIRAMQTVQSLERAL